MLKIKFDKINLFKLFIVILQGGENKILIEKFEVLNNFLGELNFEKEKKRFILV